MARTKRWSYTTGEKGRNRIRVFERRSGSIVLEYYEDGRRRRISLGHHDRDRARRQADQAAAKLARAEILEPAGPRKLTLGQLFDMYGREVTPTKGSYARKHDRRATEMFSRFFGRGCVVETLNLRDWNRFIRDRRSGQIKPAGSRRKKGVGDNQIRQDLRFLLAVFNWATMCRDERGRVLLDRNPCKGFPVPREKNPTRVVLTDEEYEALREIADEVNWRYSVALELAHETGHRISAIRQLQWSDIDLEAKTIRWRAENEKTGYEHVTPITDEAVAALQRARRRNAGIGEAPVLPAPKDPSKPMSRHLARDYWRRGERLAGLERKKGRGWHSLRRKFASDLMHMPLKVLSELGGWKEPQTILQCYQHPDQDQLRDALKDRRRATSGE